MYKILSRKRDVTHFEALKGRILQGFHGVGDLINEHERRKEFILYNLSFACNT